MTANRTPARDRGIVVMAYGTRRYLHQARSLAQSLDRNSPGIHRTLVTDRPWAAATAYYDLVIPTTGASRTDCRPKLDLDQYTPYRHTLYLDADSLAVRSLLPLFTRFADHEFVVIGKNITSGHWYGDVDPMRHLAGSASLPQFNSGLISFVDTDRTHRIFSRARELADSYHTLGLHPFNGGIADEPLLAIALAGEGLRAHDLTREVMASLLGVTGPITLDTLAGICQFEKRGRPVAPAVVHFAADYSSCHPVLGAHYRRERLKLRLSQELHVPDRLARVITAALHAALCWLFNRSLRTLRPGWRVGRDDPGPRGGPATARAMAGARCPEGNGHASSHLPTGGDVDDGRPVRHPYV